MSTSCAKAVNGSTRPRALAGTGSVAGRPVRCLTPEVQVLVHAGYELTDKDFRELHLLRERFGVELPEHLAEPCPRRGLGDL